MYTAGEKMCVKVDQFLINCREDFKFRFSMQTTPELNNTESFLRRTKYELK